MKKPIISWILEVTDNERAEQSIGKKKKSANYERLHHRIDDTIRFCKKCKRIWQRNRKMMNREWEYYPKNHIPTIGKKREICPLCEN
tara:strand:+ start:1840 stop:2100 length:261 start_codon:yes stop_codon:yes gene_type:complete